ncbi:type VII secretion system-associated protein [Streptomyces sp. NPDC001514]
MAEDKSDPPEDTTDPNTGSGPLVMDKAGLQAFLDNRVIPFLESVKNINLDDPVSGPTLATLLGGEDVPAAGFDSYETGKPLAMGYMSMEDNLGGAGSELQAAVVTCVSDVNGIYKDHRALFEDIVENLRTTIAKLADVQGGNLESMEGQELLDIFEDTVDDLAPSSGGDSGDD